MAMTTVDNRRETVSLIGSDKSLSGHFRPDYKVFEA
jgi:hypothetical protein